MMSLVCQRCDKLGGHEQPEDGDASKLFEAGAHVAAPVVLCKKCVRVLESMALRVAGVRSWQAAKRREDQARERERLDSTARKYACILPSELLALRRAKG